MWGSTDEEATEKLKLDLFKSWKWSGYYTTIGAFTVVCAPFFCSTILFQQNYLWHLCVLLLRVLAKLSTGWLLISREFSYIKNQLVVSSVYKSTSCYCILDGVACDCYLSYQKLFVFFIVASLLTEVLFEQFLIYTAMKLVECS